MPRNYFTDEQMEELSKSKWVEKVSRANVTFTNEFKLDVIGKLRTDTPRNILPLYGINPTILGSDRLRNLKYRLKAMNARPEGFRRKKTERRKFKDDGDQIQYLKECLAEAKEINQKLAEEKDEPATVKDPVLKAQDAFRLIHSFAQRKNIKLSITQMCQLADVNRSGYYGYIKKLSGTRKTEKDFQDELDYRMIKEVFDEQNIEKGGRQIKMQVLRKYGVNMNLKRVYRIMKKYDIVCTIRQPKPMKAAMRAFKTTNYKENKVNRQFHQGKAKKVLLTDITYLHYASGKSTAYLSTIKDATTKQILTWNLSESLELDIVLNMMDTLIREYGKELATGVMIHSDQGCHYTAYGYQKILEMNHIIQSMSRRGNCWDNAPQESFFSTFKCESGYRNSKTLNELAECIGKYIGYYNMRRPQWGLHKMTPFEYDCYLSDPLKTKLQVPSLYLPEVICMGMADHT